MHITKLVGENLTGYSIVELYEVYRVDEDGRKTDSIGYFRSNDIAEAFARNQKDAPWHRTRKAFVLTDGKHGFLLNEEPVMLLDDESEALKIRGVAIAKLSESERKVLGVSKHQ